MKQIYFLIITALISTSSFAQTTEDTTDWRFHDDLLNHLVGKWDVSGVVHGNKFTLALEAEWVVNHQWLRIYEKAKENVPGANVPYESWFFIGYDHSGKRYVAHLMNLFGGDNEVENLFFGNRTSNKIQFNSKAGSDAVDIEQFTWEPASQIWHLTNFRQTKGKAIEYYADLKATKSSSK